jgi:hypothetical protein
MPACRRRKPVARHCLRWAASSNAKNNAVIPGGSASLKTWSGTCATGCACCAALQVFTAVAVVSLAIGIGANTAVFSLIDALFLRSLPVASPQDLVVVGGQRNGASALMCFPMYRDLRDRQQVFTDILASAGETPLRITIPESNGGSAELDNMRVSFVTGNYFNVLGILPAIGRLFVPDDDRNPKTSESLGSVVVLSDGVWQRQFGRDAGVLGRTILIGRSPCKVLGVAPRGFFGEAVGSAPAAWVPLVPFSSPDNLENRLGAFTASVARLNPGVSREQAQSAMTVLFQQLLVAEDPARERVEDSSIVLGPGNTGIDYRLRRSFAKPLWIIMAIVALVAIGLITGIGFGLVPALQASGTDVALAVKGALRGEVTRPARQRMRRVLVTSQVALSMVLLVVAGLLVRSFQNLHNTDWGFRKEQVVIFDLAHNPQHREPSALADVAWQVHNA